MEDRALTKLFVLVTAVVLFAAGGWVWSTFNLGNSNLERLTLERGLQLQRSYEATVAQRSQSLLEVAEFVANDPTVQRVFREGAEAARSGDQATAQSARNQLLAHVRQSWQHDAGDMGDRIMHFHIPPATSFLRVHAPDKFGDDLSLVRDSILRANEQREPVIGLETGRYFTGVRAVTPVFDTSDPNQPIFIGAVELGVPLKEVLPALSEQAQADFAVLFKLEHLRARMPATSLEQYLKGHKLLDEYALEWRSSDESADALITRELSRPQMDGAVSAMDAHLIDDWRSTLGVAIFPLHEALGQQAQNGPRPVGVVVSWFSLEAEASALREQLVRTLIIALLLVLGIEVVLYLALRRERDLRIQRNASLTDAMTGIANRRHFDEMIDQEVRRATRSKAPLAVILCDIDLFKQYNDFYGHPAGDECIRQVASALKNSLRRAGDFIARYGGEEFIAILPDTDLDSASGVAERLRKSVQSLGIIHEKHPLGVVTVSAGVTAAVVKGRADGEILISTADSGLYKAKEAGRNRVVAETLPNALEVDPSALPIIYR